MIFSYIELFWWFWMIAWSGVSFYAGMRSERAFGKRPALPLHRGLGYVPLEPTLAEPFSESEQTRGGQSARKDRREGGELSGMADD
jgi:hypothetical protein